VSEGTGFPLVKDRQTDGGLYPVRCLPGASYLDAVWSGLEGWVTEKPSAVWAGGLPDFGPFISLTNPPFGHFKFLRLENY
jgi:hypothetical protein